MSAKWKGPGDALQRKSEAEMKSSYDATFTHEIYANCCHLQTRRLRHRFGLDERRARLLATLCFGEGQ